MDLASILLWIIPLLLQENNQITLVELIGLIAGIVAAIAALLGLGVMLLQVWIPIWNEKKHKQILEEVFDRGPYDIETIRASTRYYLYPQCQNLDPAQEVELRDALVATREPLFPVIDRFLHEASSHRHLLVLADSGTGKTSFVLNYYAYNMRKKKNRHRIVLVPLGQPNADERINAIPTYERGKIVIFLDALDEDVKAIQDHRGRIAELMTLSQGFRRIVVTCRTQFFPRDEEIPVDTGVVRLHPRKAGERGQFTFRKIYLSPFDDKEVARYIHRRYPWWKPFLRRQALRVAQNISFLAARPMLLAHIPDLLQGSTVNPMSISQLYEAMIEAWLQREAHWVDSNLLRRFSKRLAVEMLRGRQQRGAERVSKAELNKWAAEWGIPLEEWQLSTRSLLNRDAEGNYKFSHRSIMEYFCAHEIMYGEQFNLLPFATDFILMLCKNISEDSLSRNGWIDIQTYGITSIYRPASLFLLSILHKLLHQFEFYPNNTIFFAFGVCINSEYKDARYIIETSWSRDRNTIRVEYVYQEFNLALQYFQDQNVPAIRERQRYNRYDISLQITRNHQTDVDVFLINLQLVNGQTIVYSLVSKQVKDTPKLSIGMNIEFMDDLIMSLSNLRDDYPNYM